MSLVQNLETAVYAFLGSGLAIAIGGFLLWVLRTAISAKVTGAIQHGYSKHLEAIKSDIRLSEERIKADIKTRDDDISFIRQGVSSASLHRKSLIEAKRVDALEAFWLAISRLERVKNVARFCESLNLDALIDASQDGSKDAEGVRRFARTLFPEIANKEEWKWPDEQRLFIPEKVWGPYLAFKSVISYCSVAVSMAQNGIPRKLLKDPSQIVAEIVKYLPTQESSFTKFGVSFIPFCAPLLWDLMEKALLEEAGGWVQSAEVMRELSEITNGAKREAAKSEVLRAARESGTEKYLSSL